ncbi:reverse transcriptase domain-containing protein [Tanacetum coccineum]
MDNPNITMEEYIRVEEEKARRHGKVYNWETAKYGKIWYDEDVHDLRFVKTEFPVIVFNDELSSEKTLSCEPMFKDFENEFPAIVYNDALTSKSDYLTGSTLSPQHINEFDLKDETSFSEYDEVEQNVLYFNDLFPFNIIYPDNLKSDKENDNNEIDIIQSSGGNVNTQGQKKFLEASHDKIDKILIMKDFIMDINVNIMVWNYLVNGMLFNLIKNFYMSFGISFDPKRYYKDGVYTRMLLRPRAIRHMALPPRFREVVLDLDTTRALQFQLGRVRHRRECEADPRWLAPPAFVEPFDLEEPIENPAPPVVTMDDNRTMAQLALIEARHRGLRGVPIVVPESTADDFELKHRFTYLNHFYDEVPERPEYVVEHETEVTNDMVPPTNNGSAKDVQPPVVQDQPHLSNSEPVVITVSASVPNLKPTIPYPLRRNDERRREKANGQIEKFYKIFKDLSFKISLTDALIIMPKFSSTLKALIGNKEKLSEMDRTPLNEHCSAFILNKLPKKLGYPDKFLIPCDFLGMDKCLALADLGASINLMPLSVWKRFSLLELTPTCMTLELADRSSPQTIVKSPKMSTVKVGKFPFSGRHRSRRGGAARERSSPRSPSQYSLRLSLCLASLLQLTTLTSHTSHLYLALDADPTSSSNLSGEQIFKTLTFLSVDVFK